jgi:CRISPR-associated endonuclease Csy4
MDQYINVDVLPDPEFSAPVLMSALFAKLHRALVAKGEGEIGVSFPKANKTLGDRLRLHGSKDALNRLMALEWLRGLRDYTRTGRIDTVPGNCKYRVVSRVQAKNNLERMYRRSVKNGRLNAQEAQAKVEENKSKETLLDHPYLQLRSSSSGQHFYIFINQRSISEVPVQGIFSTYGLSHQATVPYF